MTQLQQCNHAIASVFPKDESWFFNVKKYFEGESFEVLKQGDTYNLQLGEMCIYEKDGQYVAKVYDKDPTPIGLDSLKSYLDWVNPNKVVS